MLPLLDEAPAELAAKAILLVPVMMAGLFLAIRPASFIRLMNRINDEVWKLDNHFRAISDQELPTAPTRIAASLLVVLAVQAFGALLLFVGLTKLFGLA